MHLSLVPNPSHLEAVDPVVLGKTRAQQIAMRDADGARRSCRSCSTATPPSPARGSSPNVSASPESPATAPAAASISWSTTRSASPPRRNIARSSPYPSDVAKAVQAPILHVNGDDPEAVTFACKLAIEFRQKFKRDFVIDMWCYRRFGHNEGDEPSFTQPLMYAAIREHPPISEVYGARLIAGGRDRREDGSTPRSRPSPPCSKASSRPPNPICPTRPTGSSGALGRAQPAVDPGRCAPQRRHRRRRADLARDRQDPDQGPRRLHHPQDAAAHPRRQGGDVRDRREYRLGDGRGARLRHAGARGSPGPPLGPGQRPRHVQPAPCGLGRSGPMAPNISR